VVGVDRPFERHRRADRQISRFFTFALVGILAVGALGARLFTMQIVDGEAAVTSVIGDRTVIRPVTSTRGLIVDRNGTPLVRNVASFTVSVRPAELPYSRRAEVVDRLAALVGHSPASIIQTLDANPGSAFDLVSIASDVPEDVARLIAEADVELPGVEIVVESQREYPEGTLVSQLLGYTGPVSPERLPDLRSEGYLPDDAIGLAGVESTYEGALRGTYGTERVQVDATGRPLQVLGIEDEPVAGSSLTLTIDTHAQALAEQALLWGIQEAGLQRGVVIVMNPQTGEILALVSLPTYDNNLFAAGISNEDFQALAQDPNKPLINHAINEHYPPGSTYKLVTGTGALADGEIRDTTKVMTKGFLTLGDTRFYEWNRRGWGPCDMYCGFGHSSDTYFYQLAGMLGIDRLAHWANQYGFGEPTGIDLPGEVSGIVPSNPWKQSVFGVPVFPGETYQAGIGQGYDVVTPIQLINAYATLANGGTVLRPQIVREVVGPDGRVIEPFEPDVVRQLDVDPSVLRDMRVAARNVVTIRHTYNLVELPIKVAGKSGTAEFGVRDSKGRLPFHSWFVGFTPKDPYNGTFAEGDSELAVLAFAYDSRTVGNAATEIVKYYFQLHYGIKKDYRNFDLLERGNFYRSN
jgi:penicillin-binding protein 2